MKKIVLILCLFSTTIWSQQFDKQWENVLKNEKDQKIKTANELVQGIYKKAISKKNEAQIIKCFFHLSKYSNILDENAQTKIISQLKTEIKNANTPAKAILNLIYAKCLQQYFDQNKYGIGDRTKTDSISEDFITWSKKDFKKEINATYLKSLQNEAVLTTTALSDFEAIFDYTTVETSKKQTLFDYLINENIAYYTSKINSWEYQEKDFVAFKTNFYGTTELFTKLNLDLIKDENLKTVLALYQKKETIDQTYNDFLERLQFVHTYLIKSDFDFLNALEKLQKKEINSFVLQKLLLEKAIIYKNLASKKDYPNYNVKAIAVLDSITNLNKSTNAYQQALQKKHEIETKYLNIQLQKKIYNQENARAFITYKNIDNIKVSFYKINQKTAQSFVLTQQKNDSLVQLIIAKKAAVQNIQKELVNKKDYFEYTTELLLPPLEIGNYLVYFESENAPKDSKAFAYETITVTNLSLFAWQDQYKQNYQVVDRKTGKPIENAAVKSSKFDLLTNKNGLASTSIVNDYDYVSEKIAITYKGDSLQFIKNRLIGIESVSENQNEDKKAKVQLYLDRAIYRSGQTMFYKGIAFQQLTKKSTIVAHTSFKLMLYDPNGTIVNEWLAVTNEYGSFSGKIELPKTGLTGNFRVEVDEPDDYKKDLNYNKAKNEHPFWDVVDYQMSNIYFKVEEYKRPKFEISFEPIKENYQVNQNIAVKGLAKAFSGSNLTDAKVTYTVKRFTNSYARFYNQEEPEVLASGQTTTDALGSFVVNFVAKPSANATKEQLPVFNYEIKASVTDTNGETHDSQINIKLGYHSLQLKTTIDSFIETKNKNQITLETTNLNDQFVATKGNLQLYFTKPVSTKFKTRIWSIPEIESISNSDFERLFPYEENQKPLNEDELGTLMFTKTIDSEKEKTLLLDFISDYQSGAYKLVFTAKDSFGNPIKQITNFEIIQSKDRLKTNQLFTISQVNTDPKKDGFTLVKIASTIPQLYINTIANYQSKTFFDALITLQNNEALVKIPLQNDFKNNIKIGFETIFDNQTFNEQIEISLQEPSPTLNIETISFRNKLEPGMPQRWSFKLIADKTKKESEILASMYDRSLDVFTQTNWDSLAFYDYDYNNINFKSTLVFEKIYASLRNFNSYYPELNFKQEKTVLNWFGFQFNSFYPSDNVLYSVAPQARAANMAMNEVVVVGYGTQKKHNLTGAITRMKSKSYKGSEQMLDDDLAGVTINADKAKEVNDLSQIKTRTNLSETAFFYPNLTTDVNGNLSFNFTSPEALTAWKLRLFAHNKEAVSGYLEKNVITQKELMVVPNFPRFFREKDSIVITAKITNMATEVKTGLAQLQFFDAATMSPVDGIMGNHNNNQSFSIDPTSNSSLSWKVYIPEGITGIQYKIVAKAGNFSDGEESIIPVLTNNMLVTESIPLWVRGNTKKEYTFENFKNNTSSTLKNHQFTLEYTSNPAWLAIQSLPYLMEYEHECAEQTFARFYGNALATTIVNSNPKIATVFESWRKNGKLDSKLKENEEFKALVLAETPWVRDAQSEEEKKKNLALLFDLEKMKSSQEATFDKLKRKQTASGAFAWFDGGEESEYITRHILSGLGHLSKLSQTADTAQKTNQIASTAVPYLDQKFMDYHNQRVQYLKENQKLIWSNYFSDLHFLYSRSFYLEKHPLSETLKKVMPLYLENMKENWVGYSLYEKGLAALSLHRFGEKTVAKKIIESLKETASNNEDWGMYWIANKAGWYWYQAPIETQALLIEAFAEIINDDKTVDAMKVWLLKNKQTKNWPTTKSTTEAVYALLLQGSDWLSVKDNTVIKIGDQKILTKKLTENQKESETGYLKLNWKADEINKEMATIRIQNKSKVPGFGGAYWQYFEDLDQINTQTGAVLTVAKELYLKKNTNNGAELQKITPQNKLEIGDLVTVRLVISSKEDMEFVHLKDMRASCFEPVDVLSKYEYRDRLSFYRSTKDAATHFFFDRINKGTYVLEYDLRVNNKGEFSNGITTIQSMYAPEFTGHTKGIRLRIY